MSEMLNSGAEGLRVARLGASCLHDLRLHPKKLHLASQHRTLFCVFLRGDARAWSASDGRILVVHFLLHACARRLHVFGGTMGSTVES